MEPILVSPFFYWPAMCIMALLGFIAGIGAGFALMQHYALFRRTNFRKLQEELREVKSKLS